MNKLSLLIIWRYVLGARAEKNISIMMFISFLGIFIGTFALTLIASIMNGFEKATHKKLQGIHAQIIMRSAYNEPLNADKIEPILQSEFPDIEAFSASTFKQILLQKPGSDAISNAVIIKAINPPDEAKTSIIAHKIIGSSKSLDQLVRDNSILIGDKLAHELDLLPGDSIDLLFITEQRAKGRKITLSKQEATISGLFSTGIEEFDSGLLYVSFPLLHKLFPEAGITQYNIHLKTNAHEKNVIQHLKDRFHLDVFSWKDLYPALVEALKLEKYAMFFILALITLVACMNIISLIFMQITQKRPDIAIYQAMGMRTGNIIKLFMGMGIGLCMVATLMGLGAAFCAGFLLQKYPFIRLPDTYYVSHLPIQMEWHIFGAVLVLVLIMSFIATYLPCRNIKSIHAAQILRFEG